MAKPDPALLDPARYPFTVRVEPRFGDLDVNMHLNNVAMSSMMEDARVRFNRASGYAGGLSGAGSVVASLAIEYLAEGAYPDPVDMHVAIERLGRTSVALVQLAIQGDQVLAFARVVVVVLGDQGPAALPSAFIATAQDWTLLA